MHGQQAGRKDSERMVAARRMLRSGMWPEEVWEALGFCPGSGFRKEFRAI